MMMQEKIFDDEYDRSMNYTKIDRCQDNLCIDNDEYYKQIIHATEQRNSNQDVKLKIILTNRFPFILLMLLVLTSQANTSPVYYTPMNYNPSQGLPYVQQSLPVAMVQLTDRSSYPQQSFKVYRRMPNQLQPQLNSIPSYSNAGVVQVHHQIQNPNEQQLTLQLRRERQRRAMIDRMVSLFDEDGNGQLTKDELYSMALRSNIFPKMHYYLKQASA